MAPGGKHHDIQIHKIFETPNCGSATKLMETSESFNTRTDAGSLLVAMQSHSLFCYLCFWKQVLCEVNDAQNYLQTEGVNIHQCAKKIFALQIVLEAKREEFVEDALIYAKSLCEELEISFYNPKDESGESIYLATENLAQKYAFLRPEVLLRMDELNLDQAPRDINKEEFQLELERLQAFGVATDLGCKKELIRSGSVGLLKYIEYKLEDGLPNTVIILRIFLTSTITVMPVAREASVYIS
ncbi:uncharacterized protein TNCV_1836561 [Trichonephila clavipes]|nr:uncharacterized protein TNCV_1836561 [Trichonephila clavipes]